MKKVLILCERLGKQRVTASGKLGYCICLLLLLQLTTSFSIHPYYVSVTELEYKAVSGTLEISSKIFTDDLEEALRLTFGEKVDLYNKSNKEKNERLVAAYFQKHLRVSTGGKQLKLEYLGSEIQEEALWSFFLVKDAAKLKSISVFTDLLYHYRQEQINILHFKGGTQRLSHRLTYPEQTHTFKW